MKLFIVLVLMISAAHAAWLPHDVSILFPRPSTPLAESAMKANTNGAFGVLLPTAVSSKVPQLMPSIDRASQIARLEVMAVRIDPPDIRLVWGIFDGTNRVIGLDCAVHTFYKMNDQNAFMNELAKISALTRNDVNASTALSVHPTLARETIQGPYGKALSELLLKNIGEENLFKTTFMAMSAVHLKWDFGGFIVSGGRPSSLKIPRINIDKVQIFTNDALPASYFSGGMGPAPKGQDAFNRYVSDSQKAREFEKLREAHLTARRIENPELENPDTIDCVSCHVAQQVRYLTESEEPTLKGANENRYTNSNFNLKNTSPVRTQTDNVHAFGWFGASPSVNQRTINDSAFTVSKLNKR